MPLSETQPRKTRWIGWPMRCVLILLFVWLGSKWVTHVSAETMTAIVAELRRRNLSAGYHEDVPLTGRYRWMAVGGVVDMKILADGKMAVMLKTSEGWKHNYKGVLYVDTGFPVEAEDLVVRPSDEMGHFGGILNTGRDAFFVREKLSENVYEVFFDLN